MEHVLLIFYSSEKEPEIPHHYNEAVSYLKHLKKDIKMIDIKDNPEIAEKHKVSATPILVMIKEEGNREYVEIFKGIRDMLKSDLFGQTIIHSISYKKGRHFAKKKLKNIEAIESEIAAELTKHKITNFKLAKLDKSQGVAHVTFDSDTDDHHPFHISPFLGGLFMELFGKTVYAEKSKTDKGHKYVIK